MVKESGRHLAVQSLRNFQIDLPLVPRPFDGIAKKAGCATSVVLRSLKQLQKTGAMRRYGVIIHHRKTGYAYNAMVAVSGDRGCLATLITRLLKEPAVTHCYERPSYPEWPYSLYFMIHAKTKKENSLALSRLFKGIAVERKRVLYSTREFKKVSFRI